MSFAKQCDRCGSIKTSEIDSFKDFKEIEAHSCEVGHFPGPVKTFHLCDNRYKEFRDKWIKSPS
jgi:hypothetical protein